MEERIADQFMELGNVLLKYSRHFQHCNYNKNGKNKKDELTITQFRILACILSYGGNGCIIKQLSETMMISKSALSIIITKLEIMGYIKRKHNAKITDKRQIYITLTDDGIKEVKRKAKEGRMQFFKVIKDISSEEDKKFLDESLPRIVEIINNIIEKEGRKNEEK